MTTYLNPKDRLEEVKVGEEVSVEKLYTVKQLRDMCKDKGLTGYSKLKEAELLELLELK